MAQFDDAKVGDRVWSIIDGWGEISEIEGRSLKVTFYGLHVVDYWIDGKQRTRDHAPTLFYDEVKIVAPERPNRCRVCNEKVYKEYTVCIECLAKEKREKREEKCEACDLERKIELLPGATFDLLKWRVDYFLLNHSNSHTCEKGKG